MKNLPSLHMCQSLTIACFLLLAQQPGGGTSVEPLVAFSAVCETGSGSRGVSCDAVSAGDAAGLEETIEELRLLAADPQMPREERLEAMRAIAELGGGVATQALVSLFGLRLTDEDETRIVVRGVGVATWPTIAHIRERGEAAMPFLCEHILTLCAEAPPGNAETLMVARELVRLKHSTKVIEILDEIGQKKEFSPEVIERAKGVVKMVASRREPNEDPPQPEGR